jgi:hypothetical protein
MKVAHALPWPACSFLDSRRKVADESSRRPADVTPKSPSTPTSRYEDVMRFIAELQKRSANLRVESFGKSEEGRELP